MKPESLIHMANTLLLGDEDLGAIGMFFSSKYIAHAGEKQYEGHAFIKRFLTQMREAIPDTQVIKVEILARDEDKITWQRTLRGTHKRNMMGIPPSGKAVVWTDMVVSRFEDGKISEEWVVSELAGQLFSHLPPHH